VIEPFSAAEERRSIWTILIVLSLLAIVNTELRIAKIIAREPAFVAIIAIGVTHLVFTALLIQRTRSIASVMYLLATIASFILVSGICPLSGLWSVRKLLINFIVGSD
jgi:hypothetical protein